MGVRHQLGATMACFAFVSCFAQRAVAEEPVEDGAPRRYVLANGLEVVLLPDRDASRLALVVYYRAGMLSDPPGMAGLAHLTEHMAFRGSRHVTGEQAWTWTQRWGITAMNAATLPEGTLYQMLGHPHSSPGRCGSRASAWRSRSKR
jgi:predicted Zn-dependent peptidase